jgi:DMSO/TMAO reductase YedYZ heme-binding membrane subunit
LHHIRKLVFAFSALVAVAAYFIVTTQIPASTFQITRLVETYALLAITYLYFALLASPLFSAFPHLPFKSVYLRARKAIGVSAFFFALIHSSLAFFLLLGGFSGLAYLTNRYLIAILLSFSALAILSIMATTSLPYFVVKLGRNWKKLHRLVYLAAVLILIHALLLGSHFSDLSTTIPQITFVALIFLLILEAFRLDKFIYSRLPNLPRYGIAVLLVTAGITFSVIYSFLPRSSTPSFNIHSEHQQLASESQEQSNTTGTNPSLSGDKTKRYSVSFVEPTGLSSNQEFNLNFKVFDASNGKPVVFFALPYEKPFHLIIVNNELTYFSHLHPEQTENEFMITASLPAEGIYRLYLDFQPIGAIEQQFAFTLKIGNPSLTTSNQKPDTNLSKVFGDILVTLSSEGSLKASQLSLGKQKIIFNLHNATTHQPVTDLKPYLATYGHLVMINQETYEYTHVHPFNLTKPDPNSAFGPKVEFLPIGIYGPIKPGIYRTFAQFNKGGNLIVSDFTVKVE